MDDSAIPGLIGCGVGLAVALMMLAVVLAISVFIAYLLYDALRRLPPRCQQMSPGLVFLMVVPFLGIFWLFVVVMRVAQAYQRYFADRDRTDVGDCGLGVGLAWAGTAVGSIIPVIGWFSALASLVLMVMYLVQVSKLKAMVAAAPELAPPPLPPA